MENNKQETHICKWCKAETWQSDDECYANPKNKTMSNNKQTAVEWLVDELLDGKLLMPSLIEQAKEIEKEQRKIEFPSDKEIKEYTNSIRYYGHCTSEYREGIEDGVKWMRDKIQGGNNEQR